MAFHGSNGSPWPRLGHESCSCTIGYGPTAYLAARVHKLEERLAIGPAYQDGGLVFARSLGRPIDPSNLRRAWQRIVKGAGLGHVRFHDLRHAHATLMLQQGIHPKIVSDRLGHSGVGITLDTYSHVLPGLQAQAAAQLDTLVDGFASEAR